ncbi:hypothetical protein BVRB_026490 [Beta vulgaris subsp. vulgaris]|uniref:Uncharacterized protein n=1 Tax=Beta vulgaris subsp. vulgaris TaxID=3555 RepID=A0A0J8DT35_BETVV|nr:hypothetical protein BVRB_026490 [Beta vulgaris subsp. vulgaris]
MYQLRRCMTPAVHNNVAPITDKGQIYEKNVAIPIPDGSQILTICGNYSGPVLGSYTTLVPAQFGPTLDGNVAAFTTNCSQTCGSSGDVVAVGRYAERNDDDGRSRHHNGALWGCHDGAFWECHDAADVIVGDDVEFAFGNGSDCRFQR